MTDLETSFYSEASSQDLSAHRLRLGILGGLGVFWIVVAICLWAALHYHG